MLIQLRPGSAVEFGADASTDQWVISELLRYTKLIAYCGELGGKDRRGLISEGRLGPSSVADVGLADHVLTGVVVSEEQVLFQEFVAHLAVERLAVPVLHCLAGDM